MRAYNKAIVPSNKRSNDFLFWWLAPVLVLLAGLAVWSNHFESTFQDDDFHVIVNNDAIRSLDNIPHFFTRPLLYADKPEYVEYRPLAGTTFAFDYQLARPVSPAVYSEDSFAWFLLEALLLGIFAGLIPGANRGIALFAAAIFAFHPLTGETLNYASRRGDIIGSAGLLAGLVFWIVWPRYLPREIMHWEGVPKTDRDNFKRAWSPGVNGRYRAFVEAPLGLYLIPIVIGMLADPGVAVFPLLLLAYILLFDNGPDAAKPWKRVLPSAIICAGVLAAGLTATWKYGAGFRQQPIPYWITQPWVSLRYLWTFLFPVHLTAGSDLKVFPNLWSPLAIAGIAGLAGLVLLAIRLGRTEQGKAVSFGLWWFLISLLPVLLIPQRVVESDTRIYLALPGLAFAAARAAWLLYEYLARRAPGRARWIGAVAGCAAVGLIAACCWLTFERSKVWASQETFWKDITEKSPGNGRAFIELGVILNAGGHSDSGFAALEHAASLISSDAPDQIRLAQALGGLNHEQESQEHYMLALQADDSYSSAWSSFSHRLIEQQRLPEAYKAATKALQLSPWNVEAQHTLLDYYSGLDDWPNVLKTSKTLLAQDPTDAAGQRSLMVAQSAFDGVTAAERKAQNEPTPDGFLALSVQYYKMHRYEDSIEACRQALKGHPDLAEAYSNEAAAYYAMGKENEAMAALREAIRVRPDLTVAKNNLEFLVAKQKVTAKPAAAP